MSYFPVEAILTSKAEETWIKEIVDVLPLLTEKMTMRYVFDILRVKHTLHLVRSLIQWKYPISWRRLWNEIDRLFFTYGVPLANEQLQRREKTCRRFYQEKLFQGIEMVSGEGPDLEEGEKKDDFCFFNAKANAIAGRDILLRNASASRRLKMLLYLRSLSHLMRAVMGLVAPQYNLFAEWMLFATFLPVGETMDREKILIEFSCHVLRSSLASIGGALMRSLDDVVRANICTLLSRELAYELSVKLAIADEAFLQRCIEEGVAGGADPVKYSLAWAEDMASQILSRFDYEERKRIARFVVCLFSIWRRELDVAMFAAVIALLDYHKIAHAFCQWLGITVERELDHGLTCLERGLSVHEKARYGLQLMMDILVEENKRKREKKRHQDRRKAPYPHLALIVCGGSLLLDWPLWVRTRFDQDSAFPDYFKQLESFLDDVINDNGYCVLGDGAPVVLRGACVNPLVDSLKQNAAYVKEFVLRKTVRSFEEGGRITVGQGCGKIRFMGREAELILHPEEVDLLRHHHQAMSHIPRTLSFEDVFDRQPRFILRQLGLETVFAYQAAMLFQQSGCLSIMESLMDFVSSPSHNVFAQTCVRLMEFLERVLFYAFFGQSDKSSWNLWSIFRQIIAVGKGCGTGGDVEKCVSVHSRSAWEAVALLGRMGSYRVALREYGDCSFGPPFRLALQLSRYLPTTLHDASSIHYAPLVKERRRAWMTAIQCHEKIEFDDVGRIIGGFLLTKGIKFSGVYFAYPQLHHNVESGSLHLTLSNITAEFPVGQMTALVGPTGSGKSTIMRLLKRMYDPVPVITVDTEGEFWERSEGLINTIRSCLCANLPLPIEDNSENTIFLDGIPVGCFSTSYLRGAFAMLEQSPYVSERLTFLQNISLFAPEVSTEEATEATTLCCCTEFIESRPLAHNALTGFLSAGEKHRLALARAVAVGRGGFGVLLLDEPTARLDGYNGCLIEEALGGLLQPPHRMTIVIVSHRLSTLRCATYAVVVEAGKVECHGSFQEVMGLSRYFRHLVAAQGLHA